MKKLKKVLSLVLVLAMALSVFGVCASATNIEDYTDADEITYTEAVGVLSGLGVLTGDENGFRPTDTLNRAEAAKIASYLIGLQDEVVEGPTFTDVKNVEAEEIKWAAGYIAICESQGLVHGNGDGTYAPLGTLTGYEWEKIVLGALGYDAEIEGMLGDSWQGGVANLAKKVGLLDGLNSDYKAGNAITREQAAQIAFNALFAKTVVYPTTINKIAVFGDKTLGQLIFGLEVETTFDIFGAPETVAYTNGKTGASAKTYVAFPIEAVAEYNNDAKKVTIAQINEDLEDAGIKGTVDTYYEDGVAATTLPTSKLGGRGVEVAVYQYTDYTTNKEYIRVVEKNTYVKEIATGDIVAATKKVASYIDNLKSFKNQAGTAEKAYLATGELKANDIIIYNVGNTANAGGKDQVVAANVKVQTPSAGVATTVSFDGTAAKAIDNGYVKIDKGESIYFDLNAEYCTSGKNAVDVIGGVATLRTEAYYGYVYDNYDNIIYIYKTTPATVSAVGHLYVIDSISYYTDGKTENLTGSLYQPVLNPTAKAQALVILYTEDSASVEVVDLAIAETKQGTFKLVNKYGLASGPDITSGLSKNGPVADLTHKFAEYYVDANGNYIIESCADVTTVDTTKGGKDIATTDLTEESTIATTSTTLTYLTATIDPYTVLTNGNIEDVAKSVTVTAKTVTGYTNFDGFTSTAGYLERDPLGYATVGAAIGFENVDSTYVYAQYVGKVESNIDDGIIYKFIGSDGETVQYAAEVAEGADEIAHNYGAAVGTNVNAITDLADLKDAFTADKVYKLVINSQNKIVAYAELTPTTCGTVTYANYANGVGYLKTTDVDSPATDDEFAPGFGGYAINIYADNGDKLGAESINNLIKTPSHAADFVAVYTDEYASVTASETGIVFVQGVKDQRAVVERSVATTYVKGTGFVDADGKTLAIFASQPVLNGETELTNDDKPAYYGKAFNVIYEDTYGVLGNLIKSEVVRVEYAGTDPFYFVNDDQSKLYYVDADGVDHIYDTTDYAVQVACTLSQYPVYIQIDATTGEVVGASTEDYTYDGNAHNVLVKVVENICGADKSADAHYDYVIWKHVEG